MRRGDLWLAGGTAIMLGMVVYVAQRGAPDPSWNDPRASTHLAGRQGAKALAETLRRLGIPVRRWERPLFDLERPRARGRELYAFLDISIPTGEELNAVRAHVAGGGRVFVAGVTWIERCFAYRAVTPAGRSWTTPDDSVAVAPRLPARRLPGARMVLQRIPVESLAADGRRPPCTPLSPVAVDTLLAAQDGRPVALRLAFPGGGGATLLADVRFVTNQTLKETDAGVIVIPWLLADAPARIVVDEYHHGFGATAGFWTLLGATVRWLAARPAGWSVLHLAVVGLLALAVAAVRFGPARAVIERRRRSPLEHLEALAAGLERAGGDETAVQLLVGGLRRRLSRGGRPPTGEPRHWLPALELALRDERGRQAARRLKWVLTQRGTEDRVLAAAQAVEDVWESLQLPHRPV